MSSVSGAGLAQIPRNSIFRAGGVVGDRGVFSTAVLLFTPTPGVAQTLTAPSGSATGGFISTPWMGSAIVGGATAYQAISAGTAVFKDLGDTIVSAGRTFRRVQLANYSTGTDMNGGTYGATTDSDAFVGYIEVGFRGNNYFTRAY